MPNQDFNQQMFQGADGEWHPIGEYSENWVNLADARYTGEVIFMSAELLLGALATSCPDPLEVTAIHIPGTKVHVDRRIISALTYALEEMDQTPDVTGTLTALDQLLEDNPERPLQ